MGAEVPPSTRNRRVSRRRPTRSGVRICLRAGTLGLGPNLAAGLVDVSEDGVCVRLKAPLAPDSEAEIVLDKVGSSRPMKLVADVRWCQDDPAGGYRAGLHFRRRLRYKDLMDLARN
jgi:hypothetical protein